MWPKTALLQLDGSFAHIDETAGAPATLANDHNDPDYCTHTAALSSLAFECRFFSLLCWWSLFLVLMIFADPQLHTHNPLPDY